MGHLVHMVRGLVAWVATVLGLVCCATAAALTAPAGDGHRHWHRWGTTWGRFVLWLCGIEVDTAGLERYKRLAATGPHILACNHQSMLDMAVLLAVLPDYFAFLSKAEVLSIPFLGACAARTGVISLKRGDRRDASHALQAAVGTLRTGKSVLIFPEGTRTRDGHLRHFKRGAMLLSAESGAPVVPVAIAGTYDRMPPGTLFPTSGRVHLRVGAPLPVPATTGDADVLPATDELRLSVHSLIDLPSASEPRALPSPIHAGPGALVR
jgi:1-acyl-sn-glycerol-3-phosphate acyltransferase